MASSSGSSRPRGQPATPTPSTSGAGAERSNLLRLAAELGLTDQVRLRGYRPEAREVLPRYHVYVHSSHSESSCLAIMEAMAAGRPVVSSTGGALTALFDDPQEGRFWPLDDPDRAAEILVDLMESEPERARVGAAARARFLRHFDSDVVAPRLISFLRGEPAAHALTEGRPVQEVAS